MITKSGRPRGGWLALIIPLLLVSSLDFQERWLLNSAGLGMLDGMRSGGTQQTQQAIHQFQQLAETGYAPAAARLAWMLIEQGQLAHGVRLLGELRNPDPLLWWAAGLHCWMDGDPDCAERCWSAFIEARPRALYRLLWTVQMLPDGKGAGLPSMLAVLAPIAATSDPDYLYAYILAGEMNPGGGEDWLGQAVERFPSSPEPRISLARLRLHQDELQLALAAIEQALSLGAAGDDAYLLLGMILEALGDGDQALLAYAEAYQRSNGSPTAKTHLLNSCRIYPSAAVCQGLE